MTDTATRVDVRKAVGGGDLQDVLRALHGLVRAGAQLDEESRRMAYDLLSKLSRDGAAALYRNGKDTGDLRPETTDVGDIPAQSAEEVAQALQVPMTDVVEAPIGPNRSPRFFVRAKSVMEALDRVFGSGGWSVSVDELKILQAPAESRRPGCHGRIDATAFAVVTISTAQGVRMQAAGINSGGPAFRTEQEALDHAIATACKSAFKRAAAMLGPATGRGVGA